MSAQHYCADTENGHCIEHPSQEELASLIGDLNQTDNTFVIIAPDDDDPIWYASVSLVDPDTYLVEYGDLGRDEPELSTHSDRHAIARDLSSWLATRNQPS
ncbi:hypothetical protein [Nonomuraea sp. NPDC003709]|uniref:hypothetical protein n=1 Tax=Nonomuraea sp. NPDC003709 TaxID=3154450 RepID=UPI0033AD2E95